MRADRIGRPLNRHAACRALRLGRCYADCTSSHAGCDESSHLNSCSGNSTFFNFSLSMQERRNTCIMGQYSPPDPTSPPPPMPPGRAGYWRHPGFTLLGTFTQVDWRTGTLSYGDCAAQCDDDSGALSLGCEAFTYNEDDRLCILMVSPPRPSPRAGFCLSPSCDTMRLEGHGT
jgi:hypothetical protein